MSRPLRTVAGDGNAKQDAFSPWDGERHGRVAAAQMSKQYLSEVAVALRTLKSGYGENLASVASNAQREDELASARHALKRLSLNRTSVTGAAVDPQLQFQGHGAARQHFRIRGIDAATLSQGAREVLSIGHPSSLAGPMTVTIDPEQGLGSNVRRLDQAMATVDVRVLLSDRGDLMFSTPEAAWGKMQDRIMIKGEGKRFADGIAQRVRTIPDSPALSPEIFDTAPAEPDELRTALQRVIHALDRVSFTQTKVAGVLALASADATAATSTLSGEAMDRAAQSFLSRTQSMRFNVYAELAPALAGVSRARVMALLS